MQKRGKQFLTVLVVVAAVAGFVAWYMIKRDYVDEVFGLLSDFYRNVIMHQK